MRTLFRLPGGLGGRSVVAGVVLVVLAAAGFGVYTGLDRVLTTDPNCLAQGSIVLRHAGPAGECIGITDGSYVLDPSIASVEHDIEVENQNVVATAQKDDSGYVSIVMLLPISPAAGNVMSMTNIVEQLRGAYTAQYYANRHDVDSSGSPGHPNIRLLIGNLGFDANQWQTADSIIENAVGPAHVAAVAGIGVSLSTTQSAVEQLTAAQIPVIGSTISSNSFDNIANLVRVGPDNAMQGSVAVDYARGWKRAVLVEDQNNADVYDASLVAAFTKYADPRHQVVDIEAYNTTARDQSQSTSAEQQAELSVQNRIAQMPANICIAEDAGPTVVLFAGRGSDLAQLITDLTNRPCETEPIAIVTADDATDLPYSGAVKQGLDSDVGLYYAADANPSAWNSVTDKATAAGSEGFSTFEGAFKPLFGDASLSDDVSMMGYDAVLTASCAIRLTALPAPAPADVASELSALHGAHTVYGASGPIQFIADYSTSETGSNPVDKSVPIVQYEASGQSRFIELYWPDGEPSLP